MAAKTPVTRTKLAPGVELLYFSDIDDGDTYTSPLSAVNGVLVTPNEDWAAADSIGASFATNVVTFETIASTSDVKVSAVVWGTP